MQSNSEGLNRRQFLAASGVAATVGCITCPGEPDMRKPGTAFEPVEPASVGVDPERLARVTAFLDDERAKGSFPGAALVATRHGKTFLSAFRGGYCDGTTRDVPYGPDVVNMVYSFSKVVTATVVVMVHQDGLLDYDAPVSTYIPEFKGGGKDGITVRQCLTHSAGIPNPPMSTALTEEDWQRNLDAVCAHEVEWPLGSKTLYHGLSGAFVSAAVVRCVCGNKPWNDICRERLFDPIGARTMTFGLPPEKEKVALTPQPKKLPVTLKGGYSGMLGHPGGGCFARPEDMLRLLNLHLNGGLWNGKRLIRKNAFQEMHRVQYADQIAAALKAGKKPTHEYWALGWLTRGKTDTGWFGFGNVVSEHAYGHAGINTVIGIADPETGLALAFLTTDSPGSDEETVRLRNTVTNLVAGTL